MLYVINAEIIRRTNIGVLIFIPRITIILANLEMPFKFQTQATPTSNQAYFYDDNKQGALPDSLKDGVIPPRIYFWSWPIIYSCITSHHLQRLLVLVLGGREPCFNNGVYTCNVVYQEVPY